MTTIHYDYHKRRYWIATDAEPLWFDGPLEAEDAAHQLEIDAAVKAERDRIVAWLRETELLYDNGLADAIEAGDHLK